jgi:hypothetical protein
MDVRYRNGGKLPQTDGDIMGDASPTSTRQYPGGIHSVIPADPDALLTRAATADALTAAGYPIRLGTLATKATRGGGPPYRLFGTRPLYRWADALEWAESITSPLRRSTSEPLRRTA